jgi:hypothetical protein
MDLAEFDALTETLRRWSAESVARHGFALIEGLTATADEVVGMEHRLGVSLPEQYKAFMMRYGGGMFGFVELFPITGGSPTLPDIGSVNGEEFSDRSFIAVAPSGTVDFWGFPVAGGRCGDEVGERPRMLRLAARYADTWNTPWYDAPDDRLRARLGRAGAGTGSRGPGTARTVGRSSQSDLPTQAWKEKPLLVTDDRVEVPHALCPREAAGNPVASSRPPPGSRQPASST